MSGRFFEFIRNFPLEREVIMKIDDEKSETHTLQVGLPQGSVLSPLLFIFFCADIFNDYVDKPFKYAGDAALCDHRSSKSDKAKRFQQK